MDNTEDEIRHLLRFHDDDDVDWPAVLNRDCLTEGFQAAGSVKRLAQRLGIRPYTMRLIIAAHGIPIQGPGGNRVKEQQDHEPEVDAKATLAEVWNSYSTREKAAMIICAKAMDKCVPECALFFSCWNSPLADGESRSKHHDCQLLEHLRITGALQ